MPMSTSSGDLAAFFAPIGAITERLTVRLEHDRPVAIGPERRGACRLVPIDDLPGGVGASRPERKDGEARSDGADEFVAVRTRAAVARGLEDSARKLGPVRDQALFLLHVEISGEQCVKPAVTQPQDDGRLVG